MKKRTKAQKIRAQTRQPLLSTYQFRSNDDVVSIPPKTHESLFPYDTRLIYGDLRKTLILVALLFLVLGAIAWRLQKG